MTNGLKRLIILTVRFQNAVEEAERLAAEAYERDREFDGGEFSGPLIERDLHREIERIAQRFGFATENLALDASRIAGSVFPVRSHLLGPASIYGAAPLPE